jgi:hypothetical protein
MGACLKSKTSALSPLAKLREWDRGRAESPQSLRAKRSNLSPAPPSHDLGGFVASLLANAGSACFGKVPADTSAVAAVLYALPHPPPCPVLSRRQTGVPAFARISRTKPSFTSLALTLLTARRVRLQVLHLLDFDQRADKILRMQEEHRLAVRADFRLAVAEHARALRFEPVRARR